MAKSYFGKFESELDAQMALDQGKLLAPFVAMWEDQVHYNDLEETPNGEVGTEEYTQVPATGMTDTEYVTAGSLYWTVDDVPEWVSISSGSGYGDGSFDVTFDQNQVEATRNGSFIVRFYYDRDNEHLRNEITVTIQQEAGEAPSTGATVTLSSTELDSNQSWQYLQVSDASDLYWVANPPEWINNGEPYYTSGDNAWWFEVESNPLQEREGTFVVSFYSDDYQTWLYDKEVSLTQDGQNSYAPSFNADFYVGKMNAASGSGTTEVYILDNPGYAWSVEVDNFYDSGASSTTATTIEYEANANYDASDKTVTANFYEDDTLQILVDTKSLTIHQEGNPDALNAYWESSSEFPSQGGSQNFFVQFSNPDVAQYAFSLTDGGGHFNSAAGATAFTASSASIATGVTFYAGANTGTSTFYGGVYVEAYDGSGQTLGNYTLEFSVAEVQPEVIAVCTFVTTSDNETVNISPWYVGDWTNGAYVDGDPSVTVPAGNTTYTFASAGTHTITYVRESSDTYLQGWLQNSDMVACSLSCTTEWGMHDSSVGYTFSGCTALTSVTLDEHCVRVGDTTFAGCTALVLINSHNQNQPTTYGTFNTITSNTGELHIPVDANYTTFATDLGNNWTVVDDL